VKLKELESCGITLTMVADRSFPSSLKEIPFPPFAIYSRGTIPSVSDAIAIVGTRKATSESKENARQIAKDLANQNITIISGLALGIDGAAHRGAIEAGGKTIAVLAHGLDKLYPSSHARLAEDIVNQNGSLISEYPPGTPALPHHFLERNRIVSGLSSATIIIEAPERSGSLATARFALEQNRNVLVLPGPARHKNFAGSHRLIREGAELVTGTTDILESLDIELGTRENDEKMKTITEDEMRIINAVHRSQEPLSIDKIVQFTHLEVHTVARIASTLTLRGVLIESGTGYIIGRMPKLKEA
jgi:DNA processing protein